MLWRHGSGRLQAAPRSARRSVNGVADWGRACAHACARASLVEASCVALCWRLVRAAFASLNFPVCGADERKTPDVISGKPLHPHRRTPVSPAVACRPLEVPPTQGLTQGPDHLPQGPDHAERARRRATGPVSL